MKNRPISILLHMEEKNQRTHILLIFLDALLLFIIKAIALCKSRIFFVPWVTFSDLYNEVG